MGKVKLHRVLGLAHQFKMLKGRFCTSAVDVKKAVIHWKSVSMLGSNARGYHVDAFWPVDRMQNKHDKMSLAYCLIGAVVPEYLIKALEKQHL